MNIYEYRITEGVSTTPKRSFDEKSLPWPRRTARRHISRRAIQSFKIGAPSRRRRYFARYFVCAKKWGIRKESNRGRHSPFGGWDGSVEIPDTPAAELSRIVASSSDASGSVSRLLSPQLGPSGHLAIYHNVYYVALAYYAVVESPITLFFATRRRLRNVRILLVAPADCRAFSFSLTLSPDSYPTSHLV